MDQIKNLRAEIDEIDNTIMNLLEKRYSLSLKIGDLKELFKIDVLDYNREKIILDKASKYSHSPQIENVYKTIMKESRSLQRK